MSLREISPAVDLSVEEILELANETGREVAAQARNQKAAGARPKPSAKLID
jgi:hypothetical protein